MPCFYHPMVEEGLYCHEEHNTHNNSVVFACKDYVIIDYRMDSIKLGLHWHIELEIRTDNCLLSDRDFLLKCLSN